MFEIAGGVILGILVLTVLTVIAVCLAAIAIRYQSLRKADKVQEHRIRREQETRQKTEGRRLS